MSALHPLATNSSSTQNVDRRTAVVICAATLPDQAARFALTRWLRPTRPPYAFCRDAPVLTHPWGTVLQVAAHPYVRPIGGHLSHVLVAIFPIEEVREWGCRRSV